MVLTSSGHAAAPPRAWGGHACRGRRQRGTPPLRSRPWAAGGGVSPRPGAVPRPRLVTLAVASPPAPQQGDATSGGVTAAAPTHAPPPGSWASATTSQERKRLLLAAIKPPIYSVALVPVMVGFAVAFFDTGAFLPRVWASYVTCACLVIAWLNLSNDAWDAETSVDVAKQESVVRLTGSVATVHALASCALLAGAGGLAALALSAGAAGGGGRTVVAMLAGALACGVLYQAPPFRWSYKGLGEPLCFVSFGPLATCGFYLAAVAAAASSSSSAVAASHAAAVGVGSISAGAAVASVLVGCTTTAILFCSHFHQEATDKAAGKRSPIVRLGTARAAQTLRMGVLATYATATAAAITGALPVTVCCAALAAAPVARRMLEFVSANHGNPAVVFKAKFFATRWHAAHGLLVTLAFVAARLAGWP